MNNTFPENGGVVIIDNSIDEALPLMKVLSKMNIPFKYFTGRNEELPETPLNNVRLLFLDIELEGMEGVQNDKSRLSALANVVSKIVTRNCNPWAIIAWTKHSELINDLKSYLNTNSLFPIFILCMDKSDCKNDSGEFDISKISEKLEEQTYKLGAFAFFLIWQNIINKASSQLINEIASIYNIDDNWNNNINKILESLGEAYAGKQSEENKEKFSMMIFNNLLSDMAEQKILNQPDLQSIITESDVINSTNENEIRGELNRRILLSLETNKNPVPGNIYYYLSELESIFNEFKNKWKDLYQKINLEHKRIYDEQIKKLSDANDSYKKIIEKCKSEIKKILFPEITIDKEDEFIHIFLEVSPFCDYAQNKWKTCRILPGIMWPEKYQNQIKKADYIYRTPIFKINNGLYYFVFDIRYLTSVPLNLLNGRESKMRIRKELLNDIQTKISAHINRLGVTSL